MPEATSDVIVKPHVATSTECNEFISKHSTATNPVSLHDAIQYHHMLYQEQVRLYKEQEVKERTVHSWIASTILPSVHAAVLAQVRKEKGTHNITLRQFTKELKARFAQDPVFLSELTESDIVGAFFLPNLGNVEPERWIADWNVIYQKAMSQNIREVEGPNAIRDFLMAVGARFQPAWAQGKIAKMIEYNGAIPNTFTLISLADEFMRFRRATQVYATANNSINATLGGTDTNSAKNDTQVKGLPLQCPPYESRTEAERASTSSARNSGAR
ncbi:hypothetical protein E4U56_003845 [Claviceps arundinis]|uniref:Uncharacterized protein n=1 Tax=Claviceps arundinis TaxID=1623583 RepID=A0A9P7MX90_9HYPO|nr:hypothetical protein E4U56_003845 [Claviceps arundinis]